MRKVTFPHMGDLKIPLKSFLEELGMEVIVPPPVSKKTLDFGVKYSPEFACLPLKINMGNFIEAMELGADTIIMGGGCGPCRFGYYGEVQKEILESLGYKFSMLVLEPNLIEDYRNIKKLFGNVSITKVIRAFYFTYRKIKAMDAIYYLVLTKRPFEKKRGLIDSYYRKFLKELSAATTINGINTLEEEYQEQINACLKTTIDELPIKIGIVGEIYLVLEPFTNLNIEKKLSDLGVVVERDISLTKWLNHFLHLSNDMKLIKNAARGYLNNFVGGHGIDTIGNTVRYSRQKFDGVIQVAPFTCMPEIVSQTIIPEVSNREKIPVLSLFFDEHSGEAGLITRLEAFVDLLRRQKEQKRGVPVYG